MAEFPRLLSDDEFEDEFDQDVPKLPERLDAHSSDDDIYIADVQERRKKKNGLAVVFRHRRAFFL